MSMLYVTSDLHFGHSSEGNRAIESLARWLKEHCQPEDVLLLGGDLRRRIPGNDSSIRRTCSNKRGSIPWSANLLLSAT